jgi:hypothetical protein
MSEEDKDETPSPEMIVYGLFSYMLILCLIAWPAQILWNTTLLSLFPAVESIGYLDMLRLLILIRLILPGTGVKV